MKELSYYSTETRFSRYFLMHGSAATVSGEGSSYGFSFGERHVDLGVGG